MEKRRKGVKCIVFIWVQVQKDKKDVGCVNIRKRVSQTLTWTFL